MYKSILHQVAKHWPDTPQIQIIVKETPLVGQDYYTIIEKLYDREHPRTELDKLSERRRANAVGAAYMHMADFNPSADLGTLYPIEIAVLYHLFYRHKIILCNEKIMDSIMSDFLNTKHDRIKYISDLADSLDATSKRLFMARVLLATFGNILSADGLPVKFRNQAAAFLKCSPTARSASDILESGHDYYHHILGRIMYFAFWHEHKNVQLYLAPAMKFLTSE